MSPAPAKVRLPAVAGTFYPGDAATLDSLLDDELARARARARTHEARRCPKALVVPHAGYMYSGPVAASAYALLEPFARDIRRIVLIGPSHRVFLAGLAAPDATLLRTPLGDLTVDHEALAEARARGVSVDTSAAAHQREHSLEVQLPFIQRLLPQAKIVPLLVGDASGADVAKALDALWGGPETVLVVSSDLSHYLPYDVARKVDERTAERIVALDGAPLLGDDACGAAGINGLLRLGRSHGLSAELVDLRSSGDTQGGRAEVVGYGAFAFYEPDDRT